MTTLPDPLRSKSAFYTYLKIGEGERKFLEKYAHYRYRTFTVPKRNTGHRTILAPEKRLKYLQRKILLLLQNVYTPRIPVHGFVKKKGIISNAGEHQTRPYLINIDLSKYFETITKRRVFGLLVKLGVNRDVSDVICKLCITQNQLPQGAPTSPILSNMIGYKLDSELMQFAKENRARYTRYADDISFSSYTRPVSFFNEAMPSYGPILEGDLSKVLSNIIVSNGFRINVSKLSFAGPKSRKEVTGLIVNEFTNVKRSFVRNLRASLYLVETLGVDVAEERYQRRYKSKSFLKNVIRGRIEWIAQVRGRSFSAYRALAKRYNILFPDSILQIDPTYEELAERAVWVVEFGVGKAFAQGTAFFLEGIGLITAYHVLKDLPTGSKADLFRPSQPSEKFQAFFSKLVCENRDLAVLEHNIPNDKYFYLPEATSPDHASDEIIALGFTDFGPGDTLGRRKGHIISKLTKHGVKLLEVSVLLPAGISGGPIVNSRYEVVAVAKKGGGSELKQIGVDIAELKSLMPP